MRVMRTVGILMFDEVEVLDFAGPFEVFALASVQQGDDTEQKAFRVVTVSEKRGQVTARNGLKVTTDYGFDDHPALDVLIVPGGYGAEEIAIHSEATLAWIKQQAAAAELTASVCTGALLLAKVGLLDGLEATTHWMDIDRLRREYPQVNVRGAIRYIDQGSIVTSGGISAGIDMSLHLVERLCGTDVARKTAKRMEYEWRTVSGADQRSGR